eukprot:CAMPEP_0196130430 /NCGR_PEP_ID=MMETSP0910-20130528/804_1 /TAXON_ID=49265 /ORGANISM="Thalassiosira rotula, Strain GSO102" /LENGTH=414 /DNA_ID=CAMNT_0041389731 /DNA_START=159 /DNA_END=1403 /DNA_ORIENTATION=+
MLNFNYCHPCMEESGSELCFISHHKYERQVSCDPSGKILMQKTWQGWEVWRFSKDDKSGNFSISSWTHVEKVLCSDSKGRVYTDDKKKLIEGDNLTQGEWKITIDPGQHGVSIKSVKHGRLLAFSGKDLFTISIDGMKRYGHTTWHLEPAHRNQFFLSSKCHDKRLSCTKENKATTHHHRGVNEKWVIEPTNKELGQFTVRSLEHGSYLGSSKDGKLIVAESKQRWKIAPSSDEGILLQSIEYGLNLSCDTDGEPKIQNNDGETETWIHEPIMPNTLSEKNIWSWVGIGVTTAAVAVAAPFAVMGVVGAMGFGAGGIASGSVAAGMMSAEAIAAGGGVAVGGTVATLQSIGAAGLGVAGASAAATVGAVAGGLTSFSVAAASGSLSNEQQKIKLEDAGSHLPLCSWRMWHLLIQ